MKRTYTIVTILAILTGILISTLIAGQEKRENEIRIKIRKKADGGKTEKTDTLRYCPGDSLKAFWYSFDREKMDSLQIEIQKKMEVFHDKHMEKVHERMERVYEQMEKIRPEMERLRDSLHKSRIEVMDSIYMPLIIREMDIGKHIHEGMRHAFRFFSEEDDDLSMDYKMEYKDGKVIIIREDERGMVKKVIIMNSDGETVDVKEGKEAREFMIKNGNRSISSVS